MTLITIWRPGKKALTVDEAHLAQRLADRDRLREGLHTLLLSIAQGDRERGASLSQSEITALAEARQLLGRVSKGAVDARR